MVSGILDDVYLNHESGLRLQSSVENPLNWVEIDMENGWEKGDLFIRNSENAGKWWEH